MNPRPIRFSVIVPTLDEEDDVGFCLTRARRAVGPDAELIVVDGGSSDSTRTIAREHARVIPSPPGRGVQLSAGARAATGAILVFLHADTWLEPGAAAAMEDALGRGGGGCFRLGFRDHPSLRYRALAAAINVRTRLFRTATGDQAIFATREAYGRSGGFEPIPVFEDVRLVRALRRIGPFRVAPARVLTSARRWEREGFARTILLHLFLRLRHQLGGDPRDFEVSTRPTSGSNDEPPASVR